MARYDQFARVERQLHKTEQAPREAHEKQIDMYLCMARQLRQPCVPPQTVLDFGCGIGDSVSLLLDRGFDAYGVDVLELWGADHDMYWKAAKPPSPKVISRLHRVDPDQYVLPFADETFDFVFSSQVFEHVFNYAEVFAELGRILKRGALSVHLFPGPWTVIEPHINVPIIPFCYSPAWLSFWALVGRRSERQYGLSWRKVVELNQLSMTFNNYPSRNELADTARTEGLDVTFSERTYLECSESRPTAILKRAGELRLDKLVRPVLLTFCQRLMVLRKV